MKLPKTFPFLTISKYEITLSFIKSLESHNQYGSYTIDNTD